MPRRTLLECERDRKRQLARRTIGVVDDEPDRLGLQALLSAASQLSTANAEHDDGLNLPRALELEFSGADFAAKHVLAQRANSAASVSAALVGGLDSRAVTERLFISRHMVKDHLNTVFEAIGDHSPREPLASLNASGHRN